MLIKGRRIKMDKGVIGLETHFNNTASEMALKLGTELLSSCFMNFHTFSSM